MVFSQDISKKYSLAHKGENRDIKSFGSLSTQSLNTIIWIKSAEFLNRIEQGVVILSRAFIDKVDYSKEVTYLFSEKSPRLIFARVLNDFFSHLHTDEFKNCVLEHKKNPKIKIGENCFIGENVVIGDGTIILHNTSIFGNTSIGNNCYINTNCSISTPGLGFEYDGSEIVRFPQFGGVVIKDNVEIGPNTTIRRGALENTIIDEGTKIGSLSNIGHNCVVGKQCIFTGQITLGGSVTVGDRVYIGINSSVKNRIKIGDDSTIGMGSVVLHDVLSNTTVVGVPAKSISKNV